MIAVIGAGPAGLSAAATAAEKGEEVLLFDSASSLGGQYWRHLPSNWSDDRSLHYNFAFGMRRKLKRNSSFMQLLAAKRKFSLRISSFLPPGRMTARFHLKVGHCQEL
jgi:cation diffusion facilitator CzcD-associated flavoprotein CzcO